MVHSAKYNNAPMPHSIFFHGPYAIHGTDAVARSAGPPRTAASALRPAHAATLYASVKAEGAAISIVGAAPEARFGALSEERRAPRHRRRVVSPLVYAPLRWDRPLDDWARRSAAEY